MLEKNLGLPSNYSTPRGNLAAVSPAKGGCLFQKHTKALFRLTKAFHLGVFIC